MIERLLGWLEFLICSSLHLEKLAKWLQDKRQKLIFGCTPPIV
jgi:hypothetical protein